MIVERIRKITNETTQKFILWGLTVLIFLLPVPQFLMPDNRRMISLQATILMFALFYFAFLIAIEVINKRFKLKGSGWAIKFLAVLALMGVVSVLISKNKYLAIYGAWERYEGLFSLFSYYCIFLVATLLENEKYRRYLLYCFIGLGCVVSVYGVLQFMELYEPGFRFPGMAYVPMRNPNFYAAFAVMFTGITMGGFFLCDKKEEMAHWGILKNRSLWYTLVLLGYSACVSSSSTVVYVGLIMMFALFLFTEIATKRRKFIPFILLLLGLGVIIVIFNLCRNGGVTAEITSVWNQIQEEGSVFGDSVGTERMQKWKVTCSLLPKYGLFGCGIEQLGDTVLVADIKESFTYFDRAHNEYLHIWITEGIFAVISYIAFLCALFFPGMKRFIKKGKKGYQGTDLISEIALFAFFGYIAQAFFNISVVQVAPYFWMICGLVYRKKETDEETTNC